MVATSRSIRPSLLGTMFFLRYKGSINKEIFKYSTSDVRVIMGLDPGMFFLRCLVSK